MTKFILIWFAFFESTAKGSFILNLNPGSYGKIANQPYKFAPTCDDLLASFRSAFDDHWRGNPRARQLLADRLLDKLSDNAELAQAQEVVRSAENPTQLRLAMSEEAIQLRKTLAEIRAIPGIEKYFSKIKIDQGFIVGVELAVGIDALSAFNVLAEHWPSIKGVSFPNGEQITLPVAQHRIFKQLSYIEIKGYDFNYFRFLNGHQHLETLKITRTIDNMPSDLPKLSHLIIVDSASRDLEMLSTAPILKKIKRLSLNTTGNADTAYDFVAALPLLTEFRTDNRILMHAFLRSDRIANLKILGGTMPTWIGPAQLVAITGLTQLENLDVHFEPLQMTSVGVLINAPFIENLKRVNFHNYNYDLRSFNTLAKKLKEKAVPGQIILRVNDLKPIVESNYSDTAIDLQLLFLSLDTDAATKRILDTSEALLHPNFGNIRKLLIKFDIFDPTTLRFPWQSLADSPNSQLTELTIEMAYSRNRQVVRKIFAILSKSQSLKNSLIKLKLPSTQLSAHEVQEIFEGFLNSGIQIEYAQEFAAAKDEDFPAVYP